jgi:UV DNA damage repair endonuclease
MVRLSSDILPVFTEPSWRYFWQQADVRHRAEWLFRQVGEVARTYNVRLSFHPGQFCVLASESDEIVERSIEEFEYHATMAAWMGYGRQFQDYKINVHISGRRGPAGIRAVLGRLTPEARNCLTIENEEITHGLTDCLQLSDVVPIVLDIHHHWIREGEYIQRGDDRIKRVIDSWRGRRPVCHYSVSREDLLVGHDADTLPDHAALLAAGFKKQKLRAHSDFCWNRAVNEWALTHLEWADIMVEAKAKNLASQQLYDQLKSM